MHLLFNFFLKIVDQSVCLYFFYTFGSCIVYHVVRVVLNTVYRTSVLEASIDVYTVYYIIQQQQQ